jgi:pimeloyl-ACP methyl ester carboxylesterase
LRSTLRFFLIVLSCLWLSPAWAAAVRAEDAGHGCHLPGIEEALRCVSITVPLDAAHPDRRRLALHVTVAPAFRPLARPDPLFLLAGGPGQAASDILPLLNTTFNKVRATRDIVLIDQRGTGRSGKFACQEDSDDTLQDEAQLRAALRDCLARLHQPLAFYNTANAAADIEAVRRALGYGPINLWGGSYGTRLAQTYARAYPASVRSLVLDGVASPEQIVPAGGRDAQSALDALFKLCGADPTCVRAYPALPAEFAALMDRTGAAGGIKITLPDPRTAVPRTVTIDSRRFVGTVHGILYSAADSRRLPYLIHSAYLGNWAPFIARSNLANDFSADGEVAYGLYLAVVCAEDVPRLTPALIADDTGASFLGAPQLRRIADLCPLVNVPPAPAPSLAPIAAPSLLLAGALDPVTPPRRARQAARHMAHAQVVVVANAGHGVSMLGCAPRLLRAFLDQPRQPLAAGCLDEIPAPAFQLDNAGPQP